MLEYIDQSRKTIRRLGFFKKMKPCTALHIHMCTKDFQSEVRTHKVQKLIYNLYSDHKCTFLKPIFFCMITLSICRCRQSRSRCSHSLHFSVYLYKWCFVRGEILDREGSWVTSSSWESANNCAKINNANWGYSSIAKSDTKWKQK